MKVFKGLDHLPKFRNAVITIGSFDGVHSGHKTLLNKINQLAKKIDGESVVITFAPHPRQVIYPNDKTLKLLNQEAEKIAEIENTGIDNLVIAPFTIEFSQLYAQEYLENFIQKNFQPKYIVIGYDHQFGRNKEGDIYLLQAFAKKHSIEIIQIEKQTTKDIAISSSKIRSFIQSGEILNANNLLGHYYPIYGKVIHGNKMGHELGYPTANIQVEESLKLIPPQGIYATYVEYKGINYAGMLYIGNKPTVSDEGKISIEVHLFDFDKIIYDEYLTLRIVKFLRNDEKFDNINQLKHQLRLDQQNTELALQELSVDYFTKSNEDSIAMVLLNYKGLKHMKSYMEDLVKYSKLPNVTIWMVDNGSFDGSIEYINTNFPSIKTLQLEANHGFAEGYNQALDQIQAKWFLLLNNDVLVTKNWIEPLLQYVQNHPNTVIVQPKVLSARAPEYFEYAGAAGGFLDNLGYPFCRGRLFETLEKDEGQYNKSTSIFWASGAAMLIRSDIFLSAGGFDPDYFAHQEEIDLCWRILRAGYNIQYIPESKVYHYGGGTLSYDSPNKLYLNFRNNLITILKNEPFNRLLWLFPVRLILDGIAALKFLLEGKSSMLSAIWKAHVYVYKNWSKIQSKRKESAERVRRIRSKHSKVSKVGQVRLSKSILWEYFLRGKKHYSDFSS